MREYVHFVGGQDLPPSTDQFVERHCPANGELVARFADGGADDIQFAIEVARTAFDSGPWPHMAGHDRGRLLQKLADRIESEKDRLARIEVEEVGKPIRFARGDINGVVALTCYAAGLAQQLHGEVYTSLGTGKTGLVVREPIGVVGMIVPWNFPGLIFSQKVPFALASGCTCVVKPSELASGTALEIAKLAHEVGLPAGVINVVTGRGDVVGEALSASHLVDFTSFTGSTRVGHRIIENSAPDTKRVSVELGGEAANIVFADAHLDDAVDGTMTGIFFNQGEVCCSTARLIVQESIADEFVSRLVERTVKIRPGDPFNEDTVVGAMIHEQHMNRVLNIVEKAKAEGAALVAGGERVFEGALGNGFFIAPTIFDRVDTSMTVFREEIFGPVLSITRFRTTEEAIALANDTDYGLANAVWSSDLDTAMNVSRELKSGTVWVNTIIDGAPQLPFGGYKLSGFGREMGNAGMEEFTEIKTILLNTSRRCRVFS